MHENDKKGARSLGRIVAVLCAALVLCVFDGSRPLDDEDREIIHMTDGANTIAVLNKADLPLELEEAEIRQTFGEVVKMSAKNAAGVKELIAAIKRICAIGDLNAADVLIYNERQRSLTLKAEKSVDEAIGALQRGITFDAVTVLIEEAVAYLCELTGERVTDEVVDKVFHQFCVGK